jgi:acetoin utilization protein AcuB
MTLTNLISTNIPQLTMQDKVGKALSLLEDFELDHLCITHKEKFIGIIAKEALLSSDENAPLEALQDEFLYTVILEQEHFSKAVQLISENKLSILPVLNQEKDFVGVVVAIQVLHYLTRYIGADEPGGIIIIEMERRNFSFSEISRLVETHDAMITQLNTETNTETGIAQVTIKLNKTEIADIIATLQRFDFNIVAYFGEEAYANELQENYNHLLHYLNL